MVGGATPSTWNFGSTGPRWSEIADFEPIFARSASAETPSQKSSISTNRKSTMRFPMSLRWSSYFAPKLPKWGSKTQNGRFPSKIVLRLKKVSLCENSQQQRCKAFTGLTICAKMIGGGDHLYLKLWIKLTALERNRQFSIFFARSDSAVTPSEKSSINTNRKSTTRFQWAQDEHRTLSLSFLPPKVGSKTQCPKFEL